MRFLIPFLIVSFFETLSMSAQTYSDFIVVDQFGYLPDASKIAVIRNPRIGFDSCESFSPGANYNLIDSETGSVVFSATPEVWNGGNTDPSSGDRVWWFDFSSITKTGSYYVLDAENEVRSFEFRISPSVYNEVLKQAVRTFFYQRSGYAKETPFAEAAWADGASHLGPLQDTEARLFSDPDNTDTEKDVSGGWYDAGDYNKYTNWTASYVIEMMYAFKENPEVWTDNFNIPESGNGIPDLLDEARWGLDHLLKMQNEDGSVLSVVGVAHGSPPSSASGQSLYGPANTSATLSTAAAFALAATVYNSAGMVAYANELEQNAIAAWNWAVDNPNEIFKNNDTEYKSQGLAAGQQEVDDYGRLTKKIMAACFLFELTGEEGYRSFFDNNYEDVEMIKWNYAFAFQTANQDMLLYYTSLENATPAVVEHIKTVYGNSMMNGDDNYAAITGQKDPYMAHIKDYVWGSNSIKSLKGNMFMNVARFDAGTINMEEAKDIAVKYINYLHGVNPLNFVYLSNMFSYGAEQGVREFYHTWFADGSSLWDRVGVSTYGPAPGFLTGGPNPSYDWDGCCPGGCGSAANNQACYAVDIVPPKGQPAQKSYKDFNNSWPLNSWSVTENSCGYQTNYIRLLANFVDYSYDCNGDLDGEAFLDVCGVCSGGNTGREPVVDPSDCETNSIRLTESNTQGFSIWPNPVKGKLNVRNSFGREFTYRIVNLRGYVMQEGLGMGQETIDISSLESGTYFVVFEANSEGFSQKMVVN